jgi:hypothetical protein
MRSPRVVRSQRPTLDWSSESNDNEVRSDSASDDSSDDGSFRASGPPAVAVAASTSRSSLTHSSPAVVSPTSAARNGKNKRVAAKSLTITFLIFVAKLHWLLPSTISNHNQTSMFANFTTPTMHCHHLRALDLQLKFCCRIRRAQSPLIY